MADEEARWLRDWLTHLQAQGRNAFTLDEVRAELPHHSSAALRQSLDRLTRKGQLTSVHNGYYLIIPPQYSAWHVLPAALFVDGLMRSLNRPYYVGLLNAAALYGAAHQQPQQYFVVTTFPVMRPLVEAGVKIDFISIKQIPTHLLDTRKTDTGYLYLSSPALTACDLVRFEKRIGGLSRAATVLAELTESLQPADLTGPLLQAAPVSVLQRLGYLLDEVLEQPRLGESLYQSCRQAHLRFQAVCLKTTVSLVDPAKATTRWRVIPNEAIELDL